MNDVAEIPLAGFGKLVGFVDERIDRYISCHDGFTITGASERFVGRLRGFR